MNLFKILLAVVLVVGFVSAKVKVEKIIKADTTVIVKVDTIKKITYDTITVEKTYKDSSFLIKVDTVKKVEAKKEPVKKVEKVEKKK